MLGQDDAFALFNLTGTANVAADLAVAGPGSPPVPLVTPFTGADLVRAPGLDHVFNLRASYGDEVDKLVRHLTTVGVPRIAVLWVNNAFGRDGLAGVRRRWTSVDRSSMPMRPSSPIHPTWRRPVRHWWPPIPRPIILITGRPRSRFHQAPQAQPGCAFLYALSGQVRRRPCARAGGRRGVVVTSVVPFPWSQAAPGAQVPCGTAGGRLGPACVSFIGLEAHMNARLVVEGLKRAGRDLTGAALHRRWSPCATSTWAASSWTTAKACVRGSQFVDLTIIGKGRTVNPVRMVCGLLIATQRVHVVGFDAEPAVADFVADQSGLPRRHHGDRQIVSRRVENDIHRYTYKRACGALAPVINALDAWACSSATA